MLLVLNNQNYIEEDDAKYNKNALPSKSQIRQPRSLKYWRYSQDKVKYMKAKYKIYYQELTLTRNINRKYM